MSKTAPDRVEQLAERQKSITASEVQIGIKESDLGNAQRMAGLYGQDIRYCDAWGKWLIWNETHYQTDRTQTIKRLAVDTVKRIYLEAAQASGDERRMVLARHALKSESANRIDAMVRLLQVQPGVAITPEELDQNKWLLNVRNGTIDLRTGELLPHRQSDLMTKVARVDYDANAKCPTWLEFLERIMGGSRSMVTFLQRAVGYSLPADISEQVLFFLYGTGANGKSTFLNTLLHLFGDYGKQAEPDLLLTKKGEAHPTGVADLMGARFVVSSEIESGRRMAETLVKQLTGGDRIKARYMRQDFFEFEPTHKLWLAANHQPIIRNQDHGIWRRMRIIPFTVTIPEQERDKHLADKLLFELPGILNWAIEGCLAWQQEGLGMPPEIAEAVQQYRDEQDTMGGFFDGCAVGPSAKVDVTAFYRAYLQWCEDNSETPIGKARFGDSVKQRFPQVVQAKSNGRRVWRGISLSFKQGHRDIQGQSKPYQQYKDDSYIQIPKTSSLSVPVDPVEMDVGEI